MSTILLLEDDEGLNRGISLKLKKEGYQVLQAYQIEEAEEMMRESSVDLVISDITLPGGSGLEFGRKVREQSNVYLIYLTALDQEVDIVNGYDTGADDYITKPFSLMVLISKVNAFMRRIRKPDRQELLSGDIRVSLKEMQVAKSGNPVLLTKKELQLLLFLMQNAGHIVTKDQILENVWDMDGQFVDENTVTVNISRLKSKLNTDAISNVRGIGYIWTQKVLKD